MMMGEAEMEKPNGKWLRLDTATITILQPKRLERKKITEEERKKNLKYLQTTTYVPNGFFVYACAHSRARTTKRR